MPSPDDEVRASGCLTERIIIIYAISLPGVRLPIVISEAYNIRCYPVFTESARICINTVCGSIAIRKCKRVTDDNDRSSCHNLKVFCY